jgi:transcriptional regulator with PAS, ATPase and Fis domain
MPLHLQAKLLRVIEEKKYYRLGAKNSIEADFRVIAAIQPADISEPQKILPDLLYRLGHPFAIELPTLDMRMKAMGSVVLLKALEKAAALTGSEFIGVSDEAHRLLLGRHYEGNYRELLNILTFSVMRAKSHGRDKIELGDLDFLSAVKPLTDASHPQQTVSQQQPALDLGQVPLWQIFDEAQKAISPVIEQRVRQAHASYGSIKKALNAEGAPYSSVNFCKRLKTATGKKIREIVGKKR